MRPFGMTQGQSDDANLVARAAGGDMAAFETLVQIYHPRVWRLVWRMVGNLQDAQDLVQETFLAAFQALHRFRVGEPVAPWLMTIASHRCLNWLRSRKRSRVQAVEDVAAALRDPAPGPAESVELMERREALRQAMAALDAVPLAVVTLHYGEGLPCARIGEMLGMSETAVKVALFRARGRLRDVLKKRWRM